MNKPPPDGSLFHQITRFVRGRKPDSGAAIESRSHDAVNPCSRAPTTPVVDNAAASSNPQGDMPQGTVRGVEPLSNNWHVTQTSIGIPEQSQEDIFTSAAAIPDDSENRTEGSNLTTMSEKKQSIFARFWRDVNTICRSSVINVLLVFVPIGIAFGAMTKSMGDACPISPIVTFSMNAIAIIPLAYLLSFATECVASKLGDTVGALMNVTFGNAVELIILIALVDNQIGIVQASLLGSILANLLLILGMCFLFGGLRFQEQLYNNKVTQMSASLLCLSVISLLLPTVFHVSFNNREMADDVVLKLSRGTSIILLIIYIIYLLFQLKSHSYIYQSTPQEKIDEESHPGVLADILDNSSSDSSRSSSESDDSDGDSSILHRRRLRRALRRHRKHSVTSQDTDASHLSQFLRENTSSSRGTNQQPGISNVTRYAGGHSDSVSSERSDAERFAVSGHHTISDNGVVADEAIRAVRQKKARRSKHRSRNKQNVLCKSHAAPKNGVAEPSAEQTASVPSGATSAGRAENKRGFFSSPLPFFFQPTQPNQPTTARPGVMRRARSLPTITSTTQLRTPSPHQTLRVLLPNDRTRVTVEAEKDEVHDDKHSLSRTTAVITLLISTCLVAACAEFLVDTIDYMVEHTSVSQAFIGLIILPIVGNAAEHVTAVTVACKNKMDLAIAVSLGSSIQIALFVTPVVVLLGWCLNTDMSLYFTLFETVSLFVSTFIVNYLVMDGRTNYLEGALLISTYVIIAVAAFFYPECRDQSPASGPNFSYC